MKEMYLVEFGSSYSCDPWEAKCICPTEEAAKRYIAKQKNFESLYHITKLPLDDGGCIENEQDEYEYILKCIESSEDLDANTVMKQLKSLWTAYCLHRNLDVDTAEYDNRMAEMWKLIQGNESSPDWLDEYGRFYNAMSSYLV